MGRPDAQEYVAVVALWATLEVRHQGGADLIGQGQQPFTAGLARDDEKLPLCPPDMLDLERSYLARAQAQARQEHQHRTVANRNGGVGVAQRQHALNFLGCERLGQRGMLPLANRGYSSFKAAPNSTTRNEKPNECANGGHG